MELFWDGLKMSGIITAVCAVAMCLLFPFHLYRLWKRKRLVRISMPYQDAGQARLRIWEAFKAICKPEQVNADGSILLEPTPIRRKLGLRPVTVVFSDPNLAVITGQAVMLSAFAASQNLPFAAVPGASFGDYLKQNSKFFAWGLLLVFVAIFIFVEVADPDGVSTTRVTHSHRK